MRNLFIIVIVLLAVVSCKDYTSGVAKDKGIMLSSDYRIFQDTKVWKLAEFAKNDNAEGIKNELKNNPELLGFQEPIYGMSVLHLSIYNENYNAFLQLLKSGVKLNQYDYEYCTSPIIMVCGLDDQRHLKFLQKLVEYGANVNDVECNNVRDNQPSSRTPLMEAVQSGNKAMVEYLLNNNADINYVNVNNRTALGFSILSDEFEITYQLLLHGADCEVVLYEEYDAYQNKTPVYLKDLIVNDEKLKGHRQYNDIKRLADDSGCTN